MNEIKLTLLTSSFAGIARPAFPPRFRVHAEVAGEVHQRGSWYVGMSVGNARVTFCPGVVNGFIFIVRDDNGQAIHDYEPLGFTPTADLFHSMSVLVSQWDPEFVELEITLVDNSLNHKQYQSKFIVKRSDIGPIDRVSLIRIGERGGSAMFRNFEIVEEM